MDDKGFSYLNGLATFASRRQEAAMSEFIEVWLHTTWTCAFVAQGVRPAFRVHKFGSRLHGAYSLPSSDFDYVCIVDADVPQASGDSNRLLEYPALIIISVL